jgi:hypothetical protein
MSYCVYCGVELDEDMEVCPLCNTLVNADVADARMSDQKSSVFPKENLLPDYDKLTRIQYRRLFWKLSALILLSGCLVTIVIDLLASNAITWSKYSAATCLAIFVNLGLLSVWRFRLVVSLGISFVTLSLLIVLFDVFGFKEGWGWQLGIPILAIFYFVILIMTFLIKRLKNRGLNLISYFIISCGLISVGIESVLDRFFTGRIDPEWSLFVIFSVVPVAGILLFIHFKLKKGRDLKRFFHI